MPEVSILTRPEGRVQRGRRRRGVGASRVSILTRPEGRVQPHADQGGKPRGSVSILTRPEGRVQPPMKSAISRRPPFQSSPGQKAGCNPVVPTDVVNRIGDVSILTRPEGRVQRGRWPSPSVLLWMFQSSPGQKAGCNSLRIHGRPLLGLGCFNPHPARRPGATARPLTPA